MKFIFVSIFTLAIMMSPLSVNGQASDAPTFGNGQASDAPTFGNGPANGTQNNGQGVQFPNPFDGRDGTDSIGGFVAFALEKIVLPIGAVIVVFFVIYSGYLFVTANGSEDKLDKAKHTFLGVVIGAAILLGSVTIAAAIKGTLCEIAPSIPGLCSSSSL